jgi:hypothetical protein
MCSLQKMSKRCPFIISLMMRWACLMLAVTLTSAPASMARAGDKPCRQDSPAVFVIQGEIDDAMAACVNAQFQLTTTELLLDSRGGSVEAAIAIAQHFEGHRLSMRVRKECSSSCANYFLPLAARLIVEPGALIVIHGGADPMMVEKMRDEGEPELVVAALSQLVELQLDFARRNGIHPGWLLYRQAGRATTNALDGAWESSSASIRALIVEEKMARSCLGGVEVLPFQDALDRGPLEPSRAQRLHQQGIARSANVVCNSMDWEDVIAPTRSAPSPPPALHR